MPQAPDPITSPPAKGFQPYDAAESGSGDPQCASGTIYDKAGGSGPDPWVKVRDGGAIDLSTGATIPGSWPANGTSDGSAWKQT